MSTSRIANRKRVGALLLASALSLLIMPPKLHGVLITDPSSLGGIQTTTITFEDLIGLNGEQFGFVAGQPYTSLGLTMGNQTVVEAANIGSDSDGIAVRSSTVETVGYFNYQSLTFSSGQRGVGFYVQDSLATNLMITAYDAGHNLLESSTLTASPLTRYAGLLHPDADIFWLEIRAPHLTAQDAFASRTLIDDLSFGFVVIPEPSTFAFIGVAGFCLLLRVRRR